MLTMTKPTNVAGRPSLRNQRGLAMIETVPLIVIFVVLTSFAMGFYGVVQTAILNSIGARTYSFETFRQRTNLTYHREDGTGLDAGKLLNYVARGWRYHAVQEAGDDREKFVPTARTITIDQTAPAGDTSVATHNTNIYSLQPRNERISVNPVWVMVGYGICLNAQCGN